ncbi:hypothetical protein MSAN_00973500 [Mycena sanguinolenta]|uniref:Uncharacterized protein n=1 Tax=Mycena sanguinolenta TaxID=230812 RepID=A0A8H7DCJ5_9AGAR|nr:hypothetical protein MSAN_00973500 [Mycena sanguinolenta]
MTAHPSTSEPDTPVDVILGISTTVLTALNSVAASSPIAPAVMICLAIVKTVDNAQANRQSFRELTRDVCELVYAVISQGDSERPRSPLFQRQVQDLIQNLKEIEKFSTKRASKSFLHRFAMVSSDADRIKKYRAELEQRLRVFNLQANVSIREMVEEILKRQRDRPNNPPQSLAAASTQTAIVVNGIANTIRNLEIVHGNRITNQTNFVHGILHPGPQFLSCPISV